MNYIYLLIKNNFWMFNATGTLLFTMLAHVISSRVLFHLSKKVEKTAFIYDKALIKAIKAPISLVIWLIGLSLVSSILLTHMADGGLYTYVLRLKKIGIIFAVSWGLIRFINNTKTGYLRYCIEQSKEVDKTLIQALSQLGVVITIIMTLLSVMPIFGIPISGLLAFGGIGGAAIAFASKDLLANLFGGLVVYLDRPFKIGDWIRSPDKQIEGTVENIGLRVTCIRTFDKRPLYVPNGVFLTISVENPSRMTNRRIKTNIGIRYQDADKMDAITNQVKAMLIEHPEIDNSQTMIVNFVEYGPSSLNFMVYTFTKTTQWIKFQEIQHDVFIKIINIIRANNAECAFPTQTLQIENQQAIQTGHTATAALNSYQ